MMEGFDLIGWKAWYVIDGETVIYKSSEIKWIDLPQHGIQFLKQFWYDENRTQNQIVPVNVTGQDVYTLTNTMLQNAIPTLKPDDKRLKLGVLLSAADFGIIYKAAKADEEVVEVRV